MPGEALEKMPTLLRFLLQAKSQAFLFGMAAIKGQVPFMNEEGERSPVEQAQCLAKLLLLPQRLG